AGPGGAAQRRAGTAVAYRYWTWHAAARGEAPTSPPQDDGGRTCGRRVDRGGRTGPDGRGLAVAVIEEQHAQQGLRARPQFERHRRPQRAVRRRELPDCRSREPIRRKQRPG